MKPPTFALSAADRNFVLAVVRRIVRCEHAADDAAQDALIAAVRHYASFRGEAALRTWLYRIAVTTALGYLRKQRRSREDLLGDDELPGTQLADDGPRADDLVATRQLVTRVRALLPALHREQRAVLELRLADRTEPEIAQELGVTVANVKIRAFRARTQLRAALAA